MLKQMKVVFALAFVLASFLFVRAERQTVSFAGAEWLWHGSTKDRPAEDAFLRTRFTLPTDAAVAAATLAFTCDNGGAVKLNGREIACQELTENGWRKPIVLWDVSRFLRPGENLFEAACRNFERGWAGFIAALSVTLKDGRTVVVRTGDGTWESSADGQTFVRAASGGKAGCFPWGGLPTIVCQPSMRVYPGIAGVRSEWISAAEAPTADKARRKRQLAADGTSCFRHTFVNAGEIEKALWTVSGLGVFEAYVNGVRTGGDDALKPGYTHAGKTKYSFTYDVTSALNRAKDARNVLSAEVSAGWWRDKIVDYAGKKSAFRGELELTFADGSRRVVVTRPGTWEAGVGGPVKRAGVFDGEIYDARVTPADVAWKPAVANDEFNGEILPSDGAEIVRRFDLALKPVEAYCWKGVDGASDKAHGTVRRTRTFKPGDLFSVKPGETLVVDFGQNAAAVPHFTCMNAKEGTRLVCLSGEMLNDGIGERSRGNDGPAGSVYRRNLRIAGDGMRLEYTFGKGRDAGYFPRFTFFGYRYATITATDEVSFRLASVPVTSIKKEHETGKIATGHAGVNRLIANVYWGQLSNYLSVPTDCPQRNERLGWTADTQVFAEAGSFNADTSDFMHKWLRDLRDCQHPRGGYPGVAPRAQYGNDYMRLGWTDAGVIVPYQMWKQFGDGRFVRDNWSAMVKYLDRCAATKYEFNATFEDNRGYQWADWLSYEPLESAGGGAFERGPDGRRRPKADAVVYWNFLGACYWLWDARMMAEMAAATGRADEARRFKAMSEEAKAYLRGTFFAADGSFRLPVLNTMQTPALFVLKLGLYKDEAVRARYRSNLRKNIADHGGCLQTGFLGTSILMDTLTAEGMADVAYTLLLQRKNPSWLYSVDQGATTIWERWNSYVKATGFGPVGMNSFNHYAYGAVLAWIYKTVAGIAADPENPGFKNIVMAPVPDRRLGHVTAEYGSAAGLIKSAWRYEGDTWVWTFTVPEGATASVTLPGETSAKSYSAGTYTLRR